MADLRSKLKKRNDELNSLKEGLNKQISQVHSVFEQQDMKQIQTIKELQNIKAQQEEEIEGLRGQVSLMERQRDELSG